LRVLVVMLCLLVFVAVASADYIPWLPEECQSLRWWSPGGDIWRCLVAVLNELFVGGLGFELG